MAVGTVSTANTDNWQLIATNTPSGASSSTFSSISGYNTLMVVVKNLSPSAAGRLVLRFNGDSTNYNYASATFETSSVYDISFTGIQFHYFGSATPTTAAIKIFDATSSVIPKLTQVIGGRGQSPGSIWTGTSAITDIAVLNESGGTISGTIYLYGLAA